MKKIDLGQTIMILANLGVIAGIVFLAYEIRQNSESLRAQIRTDITENSNSIIERLMDDDMVSVLAKRVVGEDLSVEERIKINLYIRWQYRNAENVFYQYRMGNFRDEEFDGYRNFFQNTFSSNEHREFWQENAEDFSVQFRNEMDLLLPPRQ